ncbi:MAG: pilus assembly protein PilM, partial [Clostridia bacterium]|nr:pilus assembly protein PilM [Clostridia bacterium]
MALPFFSNDFLTIDIGFKYIKVAQVRKNKNNDLTIINYGIGDTPKGCIKNGAIGDQARVIERISKII